MITPVEVNEFRQKLLVSYDELSGTDIKDDKLMMGAIGMLDKSLEAFEYLVKVYQLAKLS